MQLPSNIFLANLRPLWYIPGVMAIWNMLSALVGAVHNAGGLYALRFLLGFVEAAFYREFSLPLSYPGVHQSNSVPQPEHYS